MNTITKIVSLSGLLLFTGAGCFGGSVSQDVTSDSDIRESIYVNASADDIIVDNPVMDGCFGSMHAIEGSARGSWFFEGDAPAVLYNSDGDVLDSTYITAKGDWMTDEFVDFYGEPNYHRPGTSTGRLVISKDNPSGNRELDASIEIAVEFRACEE